MRRHAKASSARSKRAHNGFGSSRLKRLALLALAFVLIAALTASAASAAKTHLYSGLSFGPDGTEATSFVSVAGVAVDPANGNVYVHDGEEGKIYKFDASGTPLNFSGLGTNAIEGVFGIGFGLSQIAVAPPGSPGVTAGDIYVANFERVLVFGPDGNQLGELSDGGQPCGVATDPAGHVFVGVYPALVREYTPSANPVTSADKTGFSEADLPFICNVAADGLGNVYAASIAELGTFKLAGLNALSASKVDPTANTLAVDPASNDLYANRRSSVAQYSPSGEPIGSFGTGLLEEANGIAVNGASGNVYVANGFPQRVEVFGPLVTLPTTTVQAASAVTPTKATLNATVTPEAIALTDCKFEYSTDTSFGQSAPCEGPTPPDSDDHPVTAALAGLQADTTYHFRLTATNAQGTGQSEELTFTTASFAATGEASQVAGTKATLNGVVFPAGQAVSECRFEYGSEFAFDKSVPCEGAIPTDEAAHPVSAAISHLIPNGTEYQFRLAINRGGLVQGPLKGFKTTETVITGLPSALAPSSATLNGTVNPEGIALTGCEFEYGPTPSLGSSVACVESAAAIGEGTSPVSIHAELTGLAPASTYFYRLLATNADGTAKGKEALFKTPGAPLVDDQQANAITETEASLSARVNPKGLATTYRFEYGTTTAYGQSTPEAQVGADESPHPVSANISGLSPETTYHWRTVATNSHATSEGPDRTFATFPAPVAESCPNRALRAGAGANLPDCRAYEMVSPAQKSGEVFPLEPLRRLGSSCPVECLPGQNSQLMSMQSSADGEAVVYTGQPFAAEQPAGSNEYLSSRSASGWGTKSLSLRLSPGGSEFTVLSPDLARALTLDSNPVFAAGVPSSEGKVYANLFLREGDGSLAPLITAAPPNRDPGTEGFNRFVLVFAGANSGAAGVPAFSHLIFAANDALTAASANAPAAPEVGPSECRFTGESCNLYEWADGELRLINVLPGNTEVAAGVIGSGRQLAQAPGQEGPAVDHAISADGSRIFFSEEPSGQVYVRIDGEETVKIHDPGKFLTASADGSKVLLADGCLYDLEAEACEDLSEGQGGFKGTAGTAEDLARIYFVDTAVLTGGEENANGDAAAAGKFNLYYREGGEARFIATLLDTDNQVGTTSVFGAWHPQAGARTAQVSSDGRHLAFMSKASLTGYDNEPKGGGDCGDLGSECFEVFEYDAVSAELTCVSCNPGGQQPLGESNLSLIKAGTNFPPLPQPSNLVPGGEGRLFFESQDTLSPRDANGPIQDVYQWLPNGVGGCERAAGCASLISSGHSANDSHFLNATPSGDDAFFITREQISPRDKDEQLDLYDARVGGGFAEDPTPPCDGEACKGALPPPPGPQSPGTSSFAGPANKKPGCPKAKKCHKQKKKQRKHRQQSKKHHQRSAKHNSGGSK